MHTAANENRRDLSNVTSQGHCGATEDTKQCSSTSQALGNAFTPVSLRLCILVICLLLCCCVHDCGLASLQDMHCRHTRVVTVTMFDVAQASILGWLAIVFTLLLLLFPGPTSCQLPFSCTSRQLL